MRLLLLYISFIALELSLPIAAKASPTCAQSFVHSWFEAHPSELLAPNGAFLWESQEQKIRAVKSYRQAQLVQKNPDPSAVSPHDLEIARKYIRAFALLKDYLYGGHNSLLLKIKVYEPVRTTPSFNGSIDLLVQRQRFTRSPWWRSSLPVAKITSETSQSLLRLHAGEDSYRIIYWPKEHPDPADGRTKIDEIRVAVNYDKSDVPKTLEIFARDFSGEWQPFLYEQIAGVWLPVRSLNKTDVQKLYAASEINIRHIQIEKKNKPRNLCSSCHMVHGKYSPRPRQMNSYKDFEQEGYFDSGMIWHLLNNN